NRLQDRAVRQPRLRPLGLRGGAEAARLRRGHHRRERTRRLLEGRLRRVRAAGDRDGDQRGERRHVAVLGMLLRAVVTAAVAAAALAPVAVGATFSVTSTADAGAGSLRQAILDANASPGADT